MATCTFKNSISEPFYLRPKACGQPLYRLHSQWVKLRDVQVTEKSLTTSTQNYNRLTLLFFTNSSLHLHIVQCRFYALHVNTITGAKRGKASTSNTVHIAVTQQGGVKHKAAVHSSKVEPNYGDSLNCFFVSDVS